MADERLMHRRVGGAPKRCRSPPRTRVNTEVSQQLPVQFSCLFVRRYDRDHQISCVTHLTGGGSGAGQGYSMTTQPLGPRSSSSPQWYPGSSTVSRSYVVAGVRAGLIALVLLAILAVIVLV